MEFVNKEYFILLTLLIPYIIWYWRNRKHSEPTMRVSTVAVYYKASKSWRQRIVHAPMFLRCLAFVMIVCVMARPQTRNSWDNKSVEGIDIMLAMDVSTSMLAEDLKPNRLEAAKNVAAEFVAGRPNDNIGLTIFAGESFTQCPMTTDHASLLNLRTSNNNHKHSYSCHRKPKLHTATHGRSIGHKLTHKIFVANAHYLLLPAP
jgi:Ca-activated chloride channel homolog